MDLKVHRTGCGGGLHASAIVTTAGNPQSPATVGGMTPPDLGAWLRQHRAADTSRTLTRAELQSLHDEMQRLRQSNDRMRKQNAKLRKRMARLGVDRDNDDTSQAESRRQ